MKLGLSPVAIYGLLALLIIATASASAAPPRTSAVSQGDPLMTCLADELSYTIEHLAAPDGTKPYFLAYTVYDERRIGVVATLGALNREIDSTDRNLNIDLRVGDYELDNTHQLRGGGPSRAAGSGNIPLPLDQALDATRHALWYYTDSIFKRAVNRMTQIKTNLKVKVEEEDQSDDFSREKAHIHLEDPAKLQFDKDAWRERARRISAIARDFPLIYDSNLTVGAYAGTRRLVSSEGARLRTAQTRYRITLSAGTKAKDGMDLQQSFDFNAATPEKLPNDKVLTDAFRKIIAQVMALRDAPLAEPYIGPAILRNRAAGVFFHEIFGHRIEGHRQKDVTEGQTFTKKIGKTVLPGFISVYDDPTVPVYGGVDLRGYYLYDDEGTRASRVTLVDSGVLQTFLMSRSPVARFPHSNGHGRRQSGYAVASRQANLIVEPKKTVPFEELRRLLVAECRRQNKPYGLLFEDISGGFTLTGRRGPQSFKVLPIVVYRVYADGRDDELIRGVDIVGTPLTCFEKITHAGNDPAVFNGSCGAESGWVPVSAVSPSILVSTIEVEKRTRSQTRPPILDPPLGLAGSSAGSSFRASADNE
ncbi:MAG: metallopeptidase TldD-related protein [Phycisphaerae bacterium]|jgi:predicted Zn-dependent protease